jgi:NDP-sugar pyrophosphorylase family protein
MQLVVPMAGAGRRFAEAGYHLPKPLIPVLGVPMVVRAVGNLPAASRRVFVCHADHVRDFAIDRTLPRYFPGCRVVVAPSLTEGQACSVRLAGQHLHHDRGVLVAACDNTHLFDEERFEALTADKSVDCLIWTYRHEPRVLVKPQAYGWVRADQRGEVSEVSVKHAVSANPIDDHVVSGCFWFRSAELLLESIDRLVAANSRVNNEFYLDSVPNLLIAQGRRVLAFEVDKYIGWGTPEDLQDYLRWRRHFDSVGRAA